MHGQGLVLCVVRGQRWRDESEEHVVWLSGLGTVECNALLVGVRYGVM
jgi:hypothetical protein